MIQKAYRGKRVLITGHTGFKGAWLSQWLLDLGAEVAGFSVDIPSNPSLFEVIGLEKRMRHKMGDIRDFESTLKFIQEFKPQAVFHLAAQSLVRPSYDDPKATFDVNVAGTVNVLEAVRRTPSVEACVVVTSDKCYENVEWEFGYRETDPLGGKDPYSASKGAAEIVLHSYARSFFNKPGVTQITSGRAGNVIGGGDWATDRIVPDCVRAWSKKEKMTMRNPDATRPWQLVLEPLSGYLTLGANLLLGKTDQVSGQSFNFGPGVDSNLKVLRLVEEFQKTWDQANYEIKRDETSGKKEAKLLFLNCDRSFQRLGWKSILTFPETVTMTAQWYQQYYEKASAQQMLDLTKQQIQKYMTLARERGQEWT